MKKKKRKLEIFWCTLGKTGPVKYDTIQNKTTLKFNEASPSGNDRENHYPNELSPQITKNQAVMETQERRKEEEIAMEATENRKQEV